MRYLLLIFIAVFVLSCDNELDLVAESKEVPVVYGLIDQADTAQYIRVERIFVDKEIAPAEIAQNPDSLYYEGINGVFASSPNYLYKILTADIPLIEEEEIRLSIEGIFEDTVVTSSTTIVEPPFLSSPQNGDLLSFSPPTRDIGIGWNPRDNNVIFTALFHMNISEIQGGEETDIRLSWLVASNTEKRILETEGGEFYHFLADRLEKDNSIIRVLNSMEFELISGNMEIADYIRVGQANLGITSSGEIPVFSNISNLNFQ